LTPSVNGYGHSRNVSGSSTTSNRAPPPPPPAAPAAAKKNTYRVLYDFTGQTGSELSIMKDEIIEIVQKEENGKITHSNSHAILIVGLTRASRLVACEEAQLVYPRLGALGIPEGRSPAATRRLSSSCPSTSATSCERRSAPCSKGKARCARPASQAPDRRSNETCSSACAEGQRDQPWDEWEWEWTRHAGQFEQSCPKHGRRACRGIEGQAGEYARKKGGGR